MYFKMRILLFSFLLFITISPSVNLEYNSTILLDKTANNTRLPLQGRSMNAINNFYKSESKKEPNSVSWDTSEKYGGYEYFYSDFKNSKPGFGYTDNKLSSHYDKIDIPKQHSQHDKGQESKYNLDNLVSVVSSNNYASPSCVCKDTYGDSKGYGSGGKYEYGDGYGEGKGYGSGGKYGYNEYEHKKKDYKDESYKMPTIVVHDDKHEDDISNLYPLILPIIQNQQIAETTGIISTLGLIFDNIIKILTRREATGSHRHSDISNLLPVLIALLERLRN